MFPITRQIFNFFKKKVFGLSCRGHGRKIFRLKGGFKKIERHQIFYFTQSNHLQILSSVWNRHIDRYVWCLSHFGHHCVSWL